MDGIDVIVGGHGHNRMKEALQVRQTLIVQAGAHSSDLGRLDLMIENGSRRLAPPDVDHQGDELVRRDQQSSGVGVGVNESKGRKRDILKNVLGGLVVVGVLFLGFAPDSVWHGGGVAPGGERKEGGSFALPDLDGNLWRLEDHRGKVVLVNYWATWCPPCRAETPGLVRLADEYKSRGLEVVGISLDEDTGAIRPFVDEYGVPYPILIPSDRTNLSLTVEVLPTTVLYDRRGRVAKRYTGAVSESIFRADVESLLREQ